MSKKIEFEYQNKSYCLEYNRDAIKWMESQGFNYSEFVKKPITMSEIAFQGAFVMNHKNIRMAEIQEIYESLADKTVLNTTLLEMVQETIDDLYSDKKEDGKNVGWKVV